MKKGRRTRKAKESFRRGIQGGYDQVDCSQLSYSPGLPRGLAKKTHCWTLPSVPELGGDGWDLLTNTSSKSPGDASATVGRGSGAHALGTTATESLGMPRKRLQVLTCFNTSSGTAFWYESDGSYRFGSPHFDFLFSSTF